jgi:hypothetical protein
MKPIWRLAYLNPGSDIGVTYAPPLADDDLDGEPDMHIFSVHVWHAHSEQCIDFAKELCALMNQKGVKPPDGWSSES